MSRIQLAVGISIALVVVARFVAGWIISRPHPYDFDPHKHQVVVNIVVHAPTADGEDIDEYDIPGVWWDSTNKSFHTQYDGWTLDYYKSTASRHLAADFIAGGLIVVLLVVKRIVLLKHGSRNPVITNYPATWFLGRSPTVRYAAMVSGIMLGTVFIRNWTDRERAKNVVAVDLVVLHEGLYREFYYGSPEQVIEWGRQGPRVLPRPLALPSPDGGETEELTNDQIEQALEQIEGLGVGEARSDLLSSRYTRQQAEQILARAKFDRLGRIFAAPSRP